MARSPLQRHKHCIRKHTANDMQFTLHLVPRYDHQEPFAAMRQDNTQAIIAHRLDVASLGQVVNLHIEIFQIHMIAHPSTLTYLLSVPQDMA